TGAPPRKDRAPAGAPLDTGLRNDHDVVLTRVVAGPRAARGARGLEVEAAVDQLLVVAAGADGVVTVTRGPVEHAAVVEAVDRSDTGDLVAVHRRCRAGRAGRVAGVPHVLDGDAR